MLDLTTATDHQDAYVWLVVLIAHAGVGLVMAGVIAAHPDSARRLSGPRRRHDIRRHDQRLGQYILGCPQRDNPSPAAGRVMTPICWIIPAVMQKLEPANE